MPPSRALVLVVLVIGASVGTVALNASPPGTDPIDTSGPTGFQTFASAADFTEYVQQANREYGTAPRFDAFGGQGLEVADGGVNVDVVMTTGSSMKAETPRYSTTNVQELGIDEPDLVKSDGQVAYFSPYGEYYHSYRESPKGVHALSVSPPGTIEQLGAINDSGRLLRVNDTLVVLGTDAIVGYDVSDPQNPSQVWHRSLDGSIRAARLMDGQIFLVMASGIQRQPCPVEPLDGVSTPCAEILHPTTLVPSDTTYTVTRLDATTGEPGDSRTFVGSRQSVVYMSEDSLYVTLTQPTPRGELLTEFLLAEAGDDLPDHAIDRLERVRGYNLTDRALYYEAQHTLDSWLATMDTEERKAANEELAAKYENYTREHIRDLTTTRIVEIGTQDLDVEASGSVPGRPLNQWALDEHNGTLRIATTVEAPRMRWRPANTSNDVYTLDSDLDVMGSVTGMSDGQEVFGVRFMGETGYVITFRQVDPLHVIDLSDPTDPEEKGQLKLPGFSRYLHPLSGDRLLGIGEEDGRVKTVIFDVSDPTDPRIDESRILRSSWSAAVNNHHAFLEDPRHDVFYIPSEYGGQVMSTETLETKHRVGITRPKRAIYVGDHLYVFGQNEVEVIDETTWERTDSLWLSPP